MTNSELFNFTHQFLAALERELVERTGNIYALAPLNHRAFVTAVQKAKAEDRFFIAHTMVGLDCPDFREILSFGALAGLITWLSPPELEFRINMSPRQINKFAAEPGFDFAVLLANEYLNATLGPKPS